MTTIRNSRISTTHKYAKIAGVPELSLESLDFEYSDDDLQSIASVSSPASTNAALEQRKISRAEGCFITKEPGFALERIHWVKAVRTDAVLKLEVINHLEDLGVVPRNFSLDAPSNLARMDRNIYYALDKQGFLAVTCSKEALLSLISLVEKENSIWKERDGRYMRFFDFNEPPFTDAMYDLVVLHPHHFLPMKGNAVTIFTEQGDDLSGKLYFVSPDGALREGPEDDQPRIPAFSSNRARASTDLVNPFLVVINAEIAFRRFKRRPHPLCAEYTELIDLTIELADKIYFEPLVSHLESKRTKTRLAYSTRIRDDVNIKGTDTAKDQDRTSNPSGIDKNLDKTSDPRVIDENSDKTSNRRVIDKNSRLGFVVKPPGLGASRDEIIEYNQYLMSGCDYYDEDEDEDEDEEDEDDSD